MELSQDAAIAPTRYLLTEKLRELRGKYKSDKPWISIIPCRKCGGKIYGGDGYLCRCCDPVERINALAEKHRINSAYFALMAKNKPTAIHDAVMEHWIQARCYIHAADIILESEE